MDYRSSGKAKYNYFLGRHPRETRRLRA